MQEKSENGPIRSFSELKIDGFGFLNTKIYKEMRAQVNSNAPVLVSESIFKRWCRECAQETALRMLDDEHVICTKEEKRNAADRIAQTIQTRLVVLKKTKKKTIFSGL